MMTLARKIGMNVPALELVDVADIGGLPEDVGAMRGQALAIERFDRLTDGSSVHIEDFAQIFGIYPKDKYKKATMVNIANVVAAESAAPSLLTALMKRNPFTLPAGSGSPKHWCSIPPGRRGCGEWTTPEGRLCASTGRAIPFRLSEPGGRG
ncbi:MAG: HipA domain-containing protein [Parahaliea sp.]